MFLFCLRNSIQGRIPHPTRLPFTPSPAWSCGQFTDSCEQKPRSQPNSNLNSVLGGGGGHLIKSPRTPRPSTSPQQRLSSGIETAAGQGSWGGDGELGCPASRPHSPREQTALSLPASLPPVRLALAGFLQRMCSLRIAFPDRCPHSR